MAIKFNVIETKFFLDVAEATQDRMEDLIPVYGFVGELWNDPDYLMMEIGNRFWLVPMEEVIDHLQDAGGDAEDFFDTKFNVWFVYVGKDQVFLQAIMDAAERGILFKD